jgi:hypothetical protein
LQWYGFDWGWGYAILLGITTQVLGFGIAGLTHRWLVQPAAMIWPQNLVTSALMYALHDHSPTDPATTNGWKIGRYKYFLIVFAGSFAWYWFPGYIFTALSVFGEYPRDCWRWPAPSPITRT